MRATEVRRKARNVGVKDTWKYSTKSGLIRAIQRQEGFSECFGTAKNYCDQMLCCWRADCLSC